MTVTHELDVSAWQAFKLGAAFALGTALVGAAACAAITVAATLGAPSSPLPPLFRPNL